MSCLRSRNLLFAALFSAAVLTAVVIASKNPSDTPDLLSLSIPDLDEKLQECPFVQDLNAQRHAALPETSSLMKRIFAILFPAGPAVNSLLATAYISGPPSNSFPSPHFRTSRNPP